jgi:hypothetical protein
LPTLQIWHWFAVLKPVGKRAQGQDFDLAPRFLTVEA